MSYQEQTIETSGDSSLNGSGMEEIRLNLRRNDERSILDRKEYILNKQIERFEKEYITANESNKNDLAEKLCAKIENNKRQLSEIQERKSQIDKEEKEKFAERLEISRIEQNKARILKKLKESSRIIKEEMLTNSAYGISYDEKTAILTFVSNFNDESQELSKENLKTFGSYNISNYILALRNSVNGKKPSELSIGELFLIEYIFEYLIETLQNVKQTENGESVAPSSKQNNDESANSDENKNESKQEAHAEVYDDNGASKHTIGCFLAIVIAVIILILFVGYMFDLDEVWSYVCGAVMIMIVLFLAKIFVVDKPYDEIEALKNEVKQANAKVVRQYEKHKAELMKYSEKLERQEIENSKQKDKIRMGYDERIEELQRKLEQQEIENSKQKDKIRMGYDERIKELQIKNEELTQRLNDSVFVSEKAKSNLSAIPYMSAIMADFETYGLEKLVRKLDWGSSQERLKKVKAIKEIRKDAEAMVEKNLESRYQLAYLLNLFPNLQDVIDVDFQQLPIVDVNDLSEYDAARDYLSKEEYAALSTSERNQLALDRYKNSHKRSKWQIGRDYELFVGYKYQQHGYIVDNFGEYMGLEDLGRDIIAKKGTKTCIIQCKYWSSKKQIHENHINQLYGTMVSYCIENNVNKEDVSGILITNIELSPMAKKVAAYLGIKYGEKFEMGEYPCIKCNIGHNEFGEKTRIYHLPFDQQYDSTKISGKDEFMAMTVAEAERAGFRRAFKWFG